jgi:aminoglycoside phosphotransferase (APT) family kinase protein
MVSERSGLPVPALPLLPPSHNNTKKYKIISPLCDFSYSPTPSPFGRCELGSVAPRVSLYRGLVLA